MLDRNINKGYFFHYHDGLMTWHQLKDEEEKQLPVDNGGSEMLCSPSSRDFRYGPLRYASLFFIPICFSLFDICDACCCCYLHLPHQIIYFVCLVLIPDCRPRVCGSVYKFSYSFISTVSIVMAIGNIFLFANMCRYFLFNQKTYMRNQTLYQILVFKPKRWMQVCVFLGGNCFCLAPSGFQFP